MQHRSVFLRVLCGAAPLLASSVAGAGDGGITSFSGVGDLPGGLYSSQAFGVSADGATVVGASRSGLDPAGYNQAFRWTLGGGLAGLGDLPGGEGRSHANAVSADGSFVAGFGVGIANRPEAFRWSEANGMVRLAHLPGGIPRSVAESISADGMVVVGFATGPGGEQAVRWSGGGITGLGDLPGGEFRSNATGVSADGGVVVGWSMIDNDLPRAFRWTAGSGMVSLGNSPALLAGNPARGVSGDGRVIVGTSSDASGPASRAWSWTEDLGFTALPSPVSNGQTSAEAASFDGRVIGGTTVLNADLEVATIWIDSAAYRVDALLTASGIDLTGWSLASVQSVSGDGTVLAGYGYRANGALEGWVAVVPSPGWTGVAALGATLLCRRRRR